MGRKRTPGLIERNGVWHIDKQIGGRRLRKSTGTRDLREAEAYLAHCMEENRQAEVYGVRPSRTFRQAATKYLVDETNAGELRSLERNAQALKLVDPYIGDLPLHKVHMDTLEPYICARREKGISNGTIRRDLAVVRRVLNLAAGLWRDEYGLTWLERPPLLRLPKDVDARKPYPLSWDEQGLLFQKLPAHLQCMALFKVNTGCREQEVCELRWEWETSIPELGTSVFVIPDGQVLPEGVVTVKNREDRLVVLNRVAQSVIEAQRGKHPEFVFTHKGKRIKGMYNSAWKRARQKASEDYQKVIGKACPYGFSHIRVHDLKHTFGRRLRAAGVSFEDRQDLLGHKSGRITTHYSMAELENLLESANRVCQDDSRKTPTLVLLRQARGIAYKM